MFIDRNIHYAGSYMLVIQYNLFFTEICGQALLVPSVYLERGGGTWLFWIIFTLNNV